jgi:protein associated with RNAse G/E
VLVTANGRDVRVVYTKYDGSLHWHYTMRYLGEDEHGTWLGAPPGLVARRGHQHEVVFREAHVLLFPRGAPEAWWTASFNAAPARTEIYCDIATPARWPDPGEVTMVDLDLDVVRRRADQRVEIVDADEFDEHQRRYGYPPEVIREAEQAAAWLRDAIRAGAEPFAGTYRDWLAQVS